MKKKIGIRLAVSLIAAAFVTFVAGMGWLDRIEGIAGDSFYQEAGAASSDIVVIGMDQAAVDELGPMPWPRSYMAQAIEYLNNADPEARPAVIGVDVLFTGDNPDDPDSDLYLSDMAGQYGNVVVASAAMFGSELVENKGEFYVDDRAVLGWDEPFSSLAENSDTGHINAMQDSDGILRHSLLYIDTKEHGKVYSFARVIYEKFCEATGQTPKKEPKTSNGFFYLPFSALGGSYSEGIGFYDLINGNVDPEIYRDKIVLIGPYASGMQDAYPVSLDHAALTYGIDIQANTIEAFQKGFFPSEAPRTLQLIFLYIISAVMLFFFWDRNMRSAIIGWILVVVAYIAACYFAYKGGHILKLSWIPMAITAFFVVSVAFNYIRERMEKAKVTNTFGHYVDPTVMNRLLEEGTGALQLGGATYDIAVLFVDIRGFTTMSEALEPQTVVEIINQYLTLTTECIMKNHGTLDKFVGDCTMAFWNAPFPQEDPVYLACCAAMDMVEGAVALGEELQKRFGRSVSFGVGVNWGPAVVGNIGAPRRMDYTAIGDTVNTAARLEANAPAGTVYISRAVADILGDRAKVTSLGGTIKLKGKADGFEILTLDSLER
ncbi:MAG: adenylate/guanylate cyclase domain-containing protein [Lachnospiraceae bacterium]|nr:adenylate/guanylate cyclase domain-containing protein [Lachnospiraceae bacterium]